MHVAGQLFHWNNVDRAYEPSGHLRRSFTELALPHFNTYFSDHQFFKLWGTGCRWLCGTLGYLVLENFWVTFSNVLNMQWVHTNSFLLNNPGLFIALRSDGWWHVWYDPFVSVITGSDAHAKYFFQDKRLLSWLLCWLLCWALLSKVLSTRRRTWPAMQGLNHT